MAFLKDISEDSIIDFSSFEGRKMSEIPAEFLLYLYYSKSAKQNYLDYISDNIFTIRNRATEERLTKFRSPID